MPLELAVVTCPVCESSQVNVLIDPIAFAEETRWLQEFHAIRSEGNDSKKDKADFTQSEATHVVQCAGCETVFRNPQLSEASLAERYANDEYGANTLTELHDSQLEFFRTKASLLDFASGTRLLEVGSFVGGFLIAAAERGWNAIGTDIGNETSEFARSIGCDVRQVDLASLDEQPFDAIFVWNTFDQIANPRQFLKSASKLLKSAGLLILRLPNGAFEARCVQLREQNPERSEEIRIAQAYNNFLSFPYLHGFTPNSLRLLLQKEGFQLASIAGDVIVPLHNKETHEWAVAEELATKERILKWCKRAKRERNEIIYPWIDVVATRI